MLTSELAVKHCEPRLDYPCPLVNEARIDAGKEALHV